MRKPWEDHDGADTGKPGVSVFATRVFGLFMCLSPSLSPMSAYVTIISVLSVELWHLLVAAQQQRCTGSTAQIGTHAPGLPPCTSAGFYQNGH